MANKPRLGNSPLKALNGTGTRYDLFGRKLSTTIQYIKPSELKPNPLNTRLFKELTIAELQSLTENIREHGIHDPLIAKPDMVLISGHNRLQAALELDLERVPVRFYDEDISEAEEVKFIISDNLLRRHLSTDQKIELYKILFPNFDERIEVSRKIGEFQSKGERLPLELVTVEPLSASQIALETGQSKDAVKKQLQTYRNQDTRNRSEQKKLNPKEIELAQQRTVLKEAKQGLSLLRTQIKGFNLDFQRNVARLLIETGQRIMKDLDS